MYLKEERQEIIMKLLKERGTVLVSDLSDYFSVSYETIRKDLSQLEKEGLLVKTHGGATVHQGVLEHSFNTREQKNLSYKKAIAKKAAELITEESTIIIGSGSTNVELSKLLLSKRNIKIFTDSLPVANILLNSENQVFFFGGQLRSKSSSVAGGWTANQIKQIKVDMSFLGSDGFLSFTGPTSPSSSDTFIDQVIMAQSKLTYIIADYTKFDYDSLYQICEWTEISALITNQEASIDKVELLKDKTNIIFA